MNINMVNTMLDHFYDEVSQDEILGPMFNENAKVDWSTHIPQIKRFWLTVLAKDNIYKGNPFQAHVSLNKKFPFKSEHFSRWLYLFEKNAKMYLSDEDANEIIWKANQIGKTLKKATCDRNDQV